MIMEAYGSVGHISSTPPPKRAFDIAFLTGVDAKSEKPDSKVPKTTSEDRHLKEPPHGSAFKKVTRLQESQTRATISTPSISPWATTVDSLSTVSSLLSPNRAAFPAFFPNPALLSSGLATLIPDKDPSNFVEEYLKAQQQILAAKAAENASGEAFNRLRSSIYSDPYKLPFSPLGYPSNPSSSIESSSKIPNPFIPHATPISALMPPTFATLPLPAQNVCAKCSVSFRMTSDLVYHMRSQHKREPNPYKKRRDEKLKCPICAESFRERHHLTRHMTAHQDRDDEEGGDK